MRNVQMAENYLNGFPSIYPEVSINRGRVKRILSRCGFDCGEWVACATRWQYPHAHTLRVYWEGFFMGILTVLDNSCLTFSSVNDEITLS